MLKKLEPLVWPAIILAYFVWAVVLWTTPIN